MSKSLLFIFVVLLQAATSFAGCGDGICGIREDTRSCPADCPRLWPSSLDRIMASGSAIRGVPYGKGMAVSFVAAAPGRAVLRFTAFDANLREVASAEILSRPSTGQGELGNAQPLILADGTILIAFRDHQLSDPRKPKYRLRVIRSLDAGKTWDFLDHRENRDGLIDEGPDGLWEPFLYLDAAGHLRVVYAKERRHKVCAGQIGRKQDIVSKMSPDGGRTWVNESVVASEGVSRDGVPSVTRLQDGSYLLVFESWQDPTCGSANPRLLIRSMQSDDGIVWKNRSLVFDPSVYSGRGGRATWPSVATLKDGRAIVSFTSDFRNLTNGSATEAKSERDKAFDIILLSSVGQPGRRGVEWDMHSLLPVYLFDRTSSTSNRFSSLTVLEDGRVVVFSGLPERFVVLDFVRK